MHMEQKNKIIQRRSKKEKNVCFLNTFNQITTH